MIEKLKWDEQPEDAAKEVQNLIDQLCDAVNELQLTVSKMENLEHLKKIGQGFKKLADPYAEQRKWLGKLCWYKLCEGDIWKVGRLEKIQENADAGYPFVFDGLCYKICEPVKPDDDIIYKGGDNE